MTHELSVSFKVFLQNGEASEVRRFGVDRDVASNFGCLGEKLQTVFPTLRGANFTIAWKDSDGDNIVISNDDELIIALTEMQADVRKLFVTVEQETLMQQDSEGQHVHVGVTCDGCQKGVEGFRYKCIQCPDYDLYDSCESKGLNAEHYMVCLLVAIFQCPHFAKRLVHHLAKATHKAGVCGGWDPKESHHWKHHHGKFHGDKHHGDKHHDCQHGDKHHDCQHGDKHHGCQHEDKHHDCHDGGKLHYCQHRGKHHDCQHEGKHHDCQHRGKHHDCQHEDKHHDCHDGGKHHDCQHRGKYHDSQDGDKDDSAECSSSSLQKSEGQQENAHVRHLGNIEHTVASILDPLEIGVNTEVRTKDNEEDSKLEEGQKKTGNKEDEVSQILVDDKQYNNTASPRSQRSPESEEWTVVTGDIPQQAAQSSSATVALSASAGSEAVPKQSETSSAPPTTSTQSSTPESTTNVYATRQPNLKPHIADALEKIMSMGFSNDGGWLTQLLESKNGDIEKALDVLQPVTVKKSN